MPTFEVDIGDATYQVDAPDENTAWTWANQAHTPRKYPEMRSLVPDSTGAYNIPSGREEAASLSQEVEAQSPGNPTLDFQAEKLAPVALGATAGVAAGPLGLLGSSIAGGAGYGVGELIKQRSEGNVEPLEAAKKGGYYALGNYAAGKAFEGASWLLGKAFTSTPDKSAVEYAREHNLPYLGDKRAIGGKLTLAGKAYQSHQIRKATEAINQEMVAATKGVQSLGAADDLVDQSVTAGRQYFDDMLSAGKEGRGGPLNALKSSVGDDLAISTKNTAPAIDDAITYLKDKVGIKQGAVYQRLTALQKNAQDARTLADMDEIYGDLWRLWNTKTNRSTRQAVETVTKAIVKDIDEAATVAGYRGFQGQFAAALGEREAFRELMKKYPEFRTLEKIPPQMTRQWLNTLFSAGGKPLESLKLASPRVYDDLSNAWLARNIWSNTKTIEGGTVLDGVGFKKWVLSNRGKLTEVFGDDTAQAVNKFADYAASSAKAIESVKPSSFIDTASRIGSETALMVKAPMVAVPAEAGSLAISYGLTNPNSWLFRMFTEGMKDTTKQALSTSLRIGGGTALAESTNPNEQ